MRSVSVFLRLASLGMHAQAEGQAGGGQQQATSFMEDVVGCPRWQLRMSRLPSTMHGHRAVAWSTD